MFCPPPPPPRQERKACWKFQLTPPSPLILMQLQKKSWRLYVGNESAVFAFFVCLVRWRWTRVNIDKGTAKTIFLFENLT